MLILALAAWGTAAVFGDPALGDAIPFDAAFGVVASIVIAAGGIAIGAWGIARRDVAR